MEKIAGLIGDLLISTLVIPLILSGTIHCLLYLLAKNKTLLKTTVKIKNKEYNLKVTWNYQEYLYKDNVLHTEDVDYPSFRFKNEEYNKLNRYHYKGEEIIIPSQSFWYNEFFAKETMKIDKKLVSNKINNF